MIELLLECSIRAVLLAAGVGVIIGALRLKSASSRHAAWCGVLAAMLLLPAYLEWGPRATVQALPAIESPAPFKPRFQEPEPIVTEPRSDRAPAPALPRPELPKPHWTPDVLLIVYGLVSALFLARLVYGTLQALALLRRASMENGFLVSSQCVCPITIGWWRPEIVLPSGWNEWPSDELEAILQHEQEHVRRRDPLVQWLAALNRCVFWFHPLAWWLERKLASLAEEACDAAVIAHGQDPQEYAEYLLHQARAIQNSRGKRVIIQGVGMSGDGTLPGRIRKLLDWRAIPQPSRSQAIAAAAICVSISALFVACQLDRIEKPLPGQPTMNELMHRGTDNGMREQAKRNKNTERAHTLSASEAQDLVAKLKQNPDDWDTYLLLLQHYQFKQNLQDLDSLRLWYIGNHPDGKVSPGNIDPHIDKPGYDRGEALWLANLKGKHVAAEEYSRAAEFLDGGNHPLAESVIEAGKKAFPNDQRWAYTYGRHYAKILMGAGEPVTSMGVIRRADEQAMHSSYAQSIRARLMESTDAAVLAHTARHLLMWSSGGPPTTGAAESRSLAHTLVDRAYSLQPDSELVNNIKRMIMNIEWSVKGFRLMRLSPVEAAALSDSDRIILVRKQVEMSWIQGKPEESAAKARELLKLAEQHRDDPLYADAVFEANIVLGKAALLGGDRREAVRHLLAAAATPGSDKLSSGLFEMNLARTLIDRGERTAVVEFLERMAPKTTRSRQLLDWAGEIRKGLNPDLMPTYSRSGCSNDPC